MISTETEDNIVESEDTNNSGSHIDDALNQPDEQGRVLVNIGHPADEPDIFLAPQIAKYIKRHQVREKKHKHFLRCMSWFLHREFIVHAILCLNDEIYLSTFN